MRLERLAKGAAGIRVQRDEQDAAGAFVKPLDLLDPLAQLVTQGLEDDACFVGIEGGAVDERA